MKIKAQVSTTLSKETLMHIDYGLLVTIYVAKEIRDTLLREAREGIDIR